MKLNTNFKKIIQASLNFNISKLFYKISMATKTTSLF